MVVVIAIVGYHVKLKLSQLNCLRARITQSLRMRSAFDVSNVIHQREQWLESCGEAESPSSDHDRFFKLENLLLHVYFNRIINFFGFLH